VTKRFALPASAVRPLATGRGGCIAPDTIVVDGRPVDYCYREAPVEAADSGWRFFAGGESEAYLDDMANSGVYDVNTIANYDPEIIPLLDSPIGAAYRRGAFGRFERVADLQSRSD
jgi:hypothetical protein